MDMGDIIDAPLTLFMTPMSDPKKPVIQQILDEWEQDAKWDPSDPGIAMSRIPIIHAKYLRYLREHKAHVRVIEQQLIRERRIRTDYYSGRLDQEQLKKYGLTPFKFVIKQEVRDYVESDESILTLNMKKANHEQIVELCESVMKELNNRTWQISGFMKWQQFCQGQG
jgi:hypothetical protein